MRATSIWIAAALACVSMGDASSAEAGKQPITFEDLLGAEGIGGAEFSPDGKWLAFTREIPATAQPSWGYEDASRLRTRLFVERSDGQDLREIPSTADVRYSPMQGRLWSPDSRGLALVASTRGGYGLAYYDLATRRIASAPERPVYATMEWLPDGRIVYPEIAGGERQRDVDATLLDSLQHHWRNGWDTNQPEVTVSSSSPVFPDRPPSLGALTVFDPHNGSHRELTAGNFTVTSASPDGRHIAAIDMAEHYPSAVNTQGRRGELQILELDGNNVRTLLRDRTIDMALYSSMAWSPSGDRFLFVGRPLRDAQGRTIEYGRDLQGGMKLYVFDLRDDKVRLLSDETLSQGNPDLNDLGVLPIGWMGNRPVAIAAHFVQGATVSSAPGLRATLDYGQTRNTRFDLFAFGGAQPENLTAFAKSSVQRFLAPNGADFAYVIADGALWKVMPGKPPQRISAADAPQIVDFGIDLRYPASGVESSYYHAGAIERISLATLSGQGFGRSVLDLTTGKSVSQPPLAQIIATSPDLLRTVTRDSEGWMTSLRLHDETSRTLVTINAKLKDKAVATAEPFTYTYNGAPLTGWVVLPPGTKPGTKLPAIVSVYGGSVYNASQPPFYVRTDMSLPVFSGQLLAQQGYAVIYPSTPLGAGADTDLMATLAGECVAAIDALAAKGIVDPAHVGVTGQSFGGFSTAAVLSQRSDRFQAGVALAGIYDFVHGYGLRSTEAMFNDDDDMDARETLMIESGQSRLAKPFWEAPDAYMRNSPIFHVDKMDAPLLLLHGDLDMAITGLSGAERLYNALLRAGKHPTLVHYWGEGHVAQSDWAMRDQWMRITRWFAYYLKNEKQPEDAATDTAQAKQ